MPRANPRLSDHAAEYYSGHFRSRNQGIEYALEAWPVLCKRALVELQGKFSVDELRLLIDVFNGTALTPSMAGQHIATQVADAIALDGLDQKWGIDGPRMMSRLKRLAPIMLASLEIWANGYWYTKPEPPDLAEYVAPLAEEENGV
jgi:hypothetical protein